jgi:ABC-type glycerol-3-phosphate transport system substrate-binding protein
MVLPLGSQNLEIWIMPNGATPAELLDARLTEFKAKHNVEVDISVLDWGVAFTRISEALASGQGPHVLQLGNHLGPLFCGPRLSDRPDPLCRKPGFSSASIPLP